MTGAPSILAECCLVVRPGGSHARFGTAITASPLLVKTSGRNDRHADLRRDSEWGVLLEGHATLRVIELHPAERQC